MRCAHVSRQISGLASDADAYLLSELRYTARTDGVSGAVSAPQVKAEKPTWLSEASGFTPPR